MRSLRRTLAVRFSLTLFLALLLIALWAFLGTHFRLSRQLDEGLFNTLELESAAIAAGLPVRSRTQWHDFDAFVREVNRFVVVRDSSGTIVAENSQLASDLPYDSVAFAAARAGDHLFATQSWGNHRIRSLYAPVPWGSGPDHVVLQLSASLQPLVEVDRSIFLLMLGTVMLGTVVTFVGAGWLAKSAVAPVAAVTAQAQGITPGTVGNRITAHADVTEYKGLVGVLNQMLERLDGALHQQRRILADLGHELRTPLTALLGELEVALRGTRSPEDYRRILQSCLEEVHHLASVADAAVMLARIETGQLRPERTPTDVYRLAHEALDRIRARTDGHSITLVPDAHDGMMVKADAQMIRLVLDHLLDNAVQHTPLETCVVLTVEEQDSTVAVAVDDNGPGIPDEHLPYLFERLYRPDAARTRAAGAGLGLTIAAAIAEAHGGSIAASRSTLGGLRIQLQLPREGVALEPEPGSTPTASTA